MHGNPREAEAIGSRWIGRGNRRKKTSVAESPDAREASVYNDE